jgi:hypothetical protein
MARWGKLRGSFCIRTGLPFLVGMSAQPRTAPDSARTTIPSRTLPKTVSPNNQGGKLVLEKGDDPKDLRKALKAAATSLSRRIRFPFRGEEGSLSFYLEGQRGRRRRKAGAEAGAPEAPKRKRGRPRKATG